MAAEPSIQERKATALADLRAGRDLVAGALTETKLSEIYGASQWGVADAVNHMVADGLPYQAMMERAIREDQPHFPAWTSAEEGWEQKKAQMLESMDEAIAFAESLTAEQLARVAICGTDEVPVIQFLEWASGHYLEHGNQITREIIPLVRGR